MFRVRFRAFAISAFMTLGRVVLITFTGASGMRLRRIIIQLFVPVILKLGFGLEIAIAIAMRIWGYGKE